MSSHSKGVEAGEGAVSIAALLEHTASSPELQQAIRDADANNDGSLSIAEVVSVFTSQRQATAAKKRMTRLAAVLGGVLLVMLAANAGLTYAVVALSQDTSTSSEGVMTVKGDPGTLVQTATYTGTADAQALLWLDQGNATELRHLSVPTPGGFRVFQVAGMDIVRGERAVFFDPSGANVTITTADVAPPAAAALPGGAGAAGAAGAQGRRLLEACAGGYVDTILEGHLSSICLYQACSGQPKNTCLLPKDCRYSAQVFLFDQLQYWQALGPDPQGVPAYQALSKKCSGLKAVTTLNKYSAMYLNNGVAVDFAHCNPADNTQAATNAAHQCCTATANALYSKVGKCKPAVVPVGYTAPGKSKA